VAFSAGPPPFRVSQVAVSDDSSDSEKFAVRYKPSPLLTSRYSGRPFVLSKSTGSGHATAGSPAKVSASSSSDDLAVPMSKSLVSEVADRVLQRGSAPSVHSYPLVEEEEEEPVQPKQKR
jgi:hypothetical protein